MHPALTPGWQVKLVHTRFTHHRNLLNSGIYFKKQANLNPYEPGEHDEEEKPDEGKYSDKELVEAEIAEDCAEVRNCYTDWNAKRAQMSQPIHHEPDNEINHFLLHQKALHTNYNTL